MWGSDVNERIQKHYERSERGSGVLKGKGKASVLVVSNENKAPENNVRSKKRPK